MCPGRTGFGLACPARFERATYALAMSGATKGVSMLKKGIESRCGQAQER